MMAAILLLAVVGAVLAASGVNNIKVPISWYNRKRLQKKTKTIYGRLMATAQSSAVQAFFCPVS